LLHMSCIRGPLLCGASSPVTSQCDLLWPAQLVQLGGPNSACTADGGTSDAGTIDAGVPAGGAAGGGAKSGGCALSARDATRATPLFGGVVGAGLVGMVCRRRRAGKSAPRG
jgi:hypothetical protein